MRNVSLRLSKWRSCARAGMQASFSCRLHRSMVLAGQTQVSRVQPRCCWTAPACIGNSI
eukprot:jgi/Hompol1/4840/HPOL_003994-RA